MVGLRGMKKYGEEKEAFEVECLVPLGRAEHLPNAVQEERGGEGGREGDRRHNKIRIVLMYFWDVKGM